MKFKAYAFNFDDEARETIKGACKLVTNEIVDIIDLQTKDIESDGDDILFLFGEKAVKASVGKSYLAKLELTEVEKLVAKIGDPEERKAAKKQLLEFRGMLESFRDKAVQNTKVEADVPAEGHVSQAPQTLDNMVKSWSGVTRDGKTIKLTEEPEGNTADINLTFEEFTALSRFMEVFGVKETKIVYKPSANSK